MVRNSQPWLWLVAVVCVASLWSQGSKAAGPPAVQAAPVQSRTGSLRPQAEVRLLLDRYCVTCHNQRSKAAGLALDQIDLGEVAAHADVWEKVVHKLRSGMMPPAGMPRPDAAAYDAVASSLERTLDGAIEAKPNPGRALLRRLNRTEYATAVRDLLGLDVDVSSLLPADNAAYGFDNIADVLGLSPSLMERYLSAAAAISEVAVGDPEAGPRDAIYRVEANTTQTQHVEGLPFGTRGGLLVRHTFPLDGEYTIKVRLWKTNVGFIRGLESPHQVEVTVDGERVFLDTVGTHDEFVEMYTNQEQTIAAIHARLQIKVPVRAGPRAVGVAFLDKTAAPPQTKLRPYLSTGDVVNSNGVPQIDHIVISGPDGMVDPGETPSRQRIFVCRPATGRDEAPCARRILTSLTGRAYRRPATSADVQPVMALYESARRQGSSFEGGIEIALRRILASPRFVFRVEQDPAGMAPGTVHPVSDLELASRLSFFLWSSLPDDELLKLASAGRLNAPAVLEQQVRRMLDDPKAQALVDNFAGQWLLLRKLKSLAPLSEEFPDFDTNLRDGFRRETELFFGSILHEDRSVLDLLTADYTFVNERLAKHYGIPRVYGSHFRRVTLAGDARRGLLGQGSILMATSYPNRTSPVVRGKWVLENLLDSPPPPPPPNVPGLIENKERGKPQTMREQMEAHRANPVCATCHKLMDPIGFALENFDGVGAWRTRDQGAPIDASTAIWDGRKINGPVELRQALLDHPERFVQTLTIKLLTYALGRGVVASDMPAVRGIVRDAARSQYRFSSLVLGLVRSVPFRMRVKPSDEAGTSVAAAR